MANGKNFFPMATGDKLVLVFLIVFSLASFHHSFRAAEVAGMSVFGWLMAALMIVSPLLTLWVFGRGRR